MITTHNEWGENEDKAVWYVLLNNGVTAFLDDEKQESAWVRLASYCATNNLTIDNMWLRFRSHVEEIGPASGYYLIKSSMGTPADKRTYNSFIVGKLVGETIKCKNWLVPELIVQEEFDRSLNDRFFETSESKYDLLIPGTQNVSA